MWHFLFLESWKCRDCQFPLGCGFQTGRMRLIRVMLSRFNSFSIFKFHNTSRNGEMQFPRNSASKEELPWLIQLKSWLKTLERSRFPTKPPLPTCCNSCFPVLIVIGIFFISPGVFLFAFQARLTFFFLFSSTNSCYWKKSADRQIFKAFQINCEGDNQLYSVVVDENSFCGQPFFLLLRPFCQKKNT